VTAPTMTALGERHRVGNEIADLTTHIEDIVVHMEMEDLWDVTLVGWSYGGMVMTGALPRVHERIRSMIYLDAFVPEDGKALVDYLDPESTSMMEAFKQGDAPIPPLPLEFFKVTDPTMTAFIEPRLTDHPWRTFFEPIKASLQTPEIPKAYVRCARHEHMAHAEALERTQSAGFRVKIIDADHFCPLTAAEETTEALIQFA
jgi:pimeloyl-ACP methyl ester carboxylesterase